MATANITRRLNCSLCQKIFTDPVLLPCGHNFCRACIQRKWTPGGSEGGQREKTCPTCNDRCPRGNFTFNRVLANLVETVKDPISQLQITKEVGQPSICNGHGEIMHLFCVEDLELCCLICRDSIQHHTHRLYPISDAAALMKKPIITHSSSVKENIEQLDGFVNEQVELIDAHKMEKLHLSQHITNEFEKLHKFLSNREKELQRELDVQGSAILLEMEQNLERLKAQLIDLRQSMAKCEERIKEPDPIKVLQGFKDFNSRFCNRRQQRHNLDVVKKALCRGPFKGPIQYHAWKAMLPNIQTVPSSAELDQDSAHMDLVFPDQFSVAYKKQRNRFRTPSPSRFSHYTMALTDEVIIEGKHYWEVDVGKKEVWYTGLASGNVNRKQSTDPSIKDGYWAICRYHDAVLNVLDNPRVPLQGRIPTRVGIYLDYEEGQVSFYDALTMVHLHSFKENFMHELYLYLAPGWVDDVPMRIVCPQL